MTSTSTGGKYAAITMKQGTMVVQLFPDAAPKTVASFISLAQSGFYNNLVWHRIVAGFVIQTGDPTSKNGAGNPATWGSMGSTQTVPLEASAATVAKGYVHDVGYLGIARSSSPDSGSSQFFINLTNNSSLNGSYTVFGKVVSGLSVATAIGDLPVADTCRQTGGLACPPANPKDAEILSITIQDSP